MLGDERAMLAQEERTDCAYNRRSEDIAVAKIIESDGLGIRARCRDLLGIASQLGPAWSVVAGARKSWRMSG